MTLRDLEPPRCVVCDDRSPRGACCGGEVCLRQIRKERIRKEEFDADNPDHFRLQSRGGAWRYYRRVDDPMIFFGDGQYRRRSACSPADIDRAKLMGSAINVGKI